MITTLPVKLVSKWIAMDSGTYCYTSMIKQVHNCDRSNKSECSAKFRTERTLCPEKVLIGRFSPTLQTYIMLSVEHVAKVPLFLQSTSRAGAASKYTIKCSYKAENQILSKIDSICRNMHENKLKQKSGREDSKAPVWNSNCCLHSPVLTSHTIAVLSTLPLRRKSPFLFHLREKIGPLCLFNVLINSPGWKEKPAHHAHVRRECPP